MSPTPRARELAPKIAAMILLMQDALEGSTEFDPATSSRTFSFASTDFGVAYPVPKLLQHLTRHASGIRVRATIAPRHGVEEMIEQGEVDVAVGSFAVNRQPFYQRRLYYCDYVCVARREHPTIRGHRSRNRYLSAAHAMVAPLPSGYEALEHFLLESIPGCELCGCIAELSRGDYDAAEFRRPIYGVAACGRAHRRVARRARARIAGRYTRVHRPAVLA